MQLGFLFFAALVISLVVAQQGYPDNRLGDKYGTPITYEEQTFDVIIVGAGTAGSTITGKLNKAKPNLSILLLEAGDVDDSLYVFCPSLFGANFLNDDTSYSYWGEPSEAPSLFSRFHPRGKLLGGSSSINAMVYQRGQKLDYDSMGIPGWTWHDVLPHFKAMEDNFGYNLTASAHGHHGPWNITDGSFHYPVTNLWIKTLHDAGIPFDNDFNDGTAFGYRYNQVNVYGGYRVSLAEAYLTPQLCQYSNVTVQVKAKVNKILFDGKKAKSVTFSYGGSNYTVHARKQVILSAGVFGSVEVLQRSGVGPRDLLQSLNIPVVHHLPGVGRNLQDHALVGKTSNISDAAKEANPSIYSAEDVLANTALFAEWISTRTGPLAGNLNEAPVFIRSPYAVDERSDITIIYAPLQYILHGSVKFPGSGISWGPQILRPESRGYVKISSTDPNVLATVNHQYFSDPRGRDLDTLAWALNYTRHLIDNSPHYQGILDQELVPGRNVQTREQLKDYIRNYVMTGYHSCCTNKMGHAFDEMAVLDNRLRVRGVEKLRVCDLSSIPNVPMGWCNAVAAMIGSKCADYILQDLE